MSQTATNPQSLQRSLEEDLSPESRQWMETHLAYFDELLRLNYGKSVEDFAEVILEETCETLNVLRGVFYLVDKESELVYATSGYACNLAHLAHTEFAMGNGLVGQAARSGRALYFADLPPRNAVIRTGLSELSARSLLNIPLEFNEEVYGVMELAHLRNLSALELRFLGMLARNIASTLQSIINNDRTRYLLEEMQAQEEEMRQSNEELMTAQEEMLKRQRELENKDAFFQTLTDSVPGVIYQFTVESLGKFYFSFVTSGLTELLGYANSKEINHALATDGFIYPDDAQEFQNSLAAAYNNMEQFVWEGRLLSSTGGYRWIKATSSPRKNNQGHVVFSGFLEDIAQRKRAEEQVATRNKMMEKAMNKAKKREEELQQQLQVQQEELERLRHQTS